MRLHEIMEDAGAATTGAGSVAVVAQPLAATQRRIPEVSNPTKYSNGPAPNYASPQRKKNAR